MSGDYRQKGRAVFLAAIMLTSMVAMSVAFVGPAAADADGITVNEDPAGEVDVFVSNDTVGSNDEIALIAKFNDTNTSTNDLYNASEDVFLNKSTNVSGDTEFTVDIPDDISADTYKLYAFAGSPASEPADGADISEANGPTQTTGTHNVEDVNYEIDSFTGDFAANPDSPVTIEATINNTGDLPSSGQDIVTNSTDAFDPQGTPQTLESGLALDPGQTATVSADLTTADVPGDPVVTEGYQVDTQNNTADATATLSNDGFIQGSVRNTQNDPIQNADVTVTNDNSGQEFTTTTDSSGAFTVAVPAGNDYEVEVDQSGFVSFSTVRGVTPGGTERIDVTLQSNLYAEKVGVALWDSEQQETVGDAAALLANGDFDNNVELVVYAQSQLNTSLDSDTTATLDVADASNGELDSATNIFNAGEGVYLNEATGDTSEDQITRTLNGSDTLDVSNFDTDVDSDATVGNNVFGDGDVSYATFNVTSGNVTADEVREFADAVAQGNITATINNAGPNANTDIEDTSSLTYFVEGEKSTQHQVRDTDGNPIEGATVFVSYDGAPQNLEDVEDFQNEAGESFLVAETNEDGVAVLPGLVPGVSYNVYVKADNFNIFNSSTAPADAGSLTAETGIDADTFVADYTLNQEISASNDGSGFDNVYAHTLRQTPQDIALDVTVADADGSQVKSTDVPSGDLREIEVSATAGELGQDVSEFDDLGGQTIDIELTNDAAGSLVGANNDGVAQVTTDENGTATVTFEAVEGQDRSTNVTASTTNANNDLYATEDNEGQGVSDDGNQAEIDVFTTGTLTGDVLDQNEAPIPAANVSLSVFNETSNEFEQIRDVRQASGSGQYVFEDLPTNEEYRINGEFQGDTGFATITELNPGTNTRDVVISEALSPTGFTVSDLDAPAEASPGDEITVSANITNLDGSTATDTVEFRLAGDTVQDESLTLGANEQQEISFDVTVPNVEDGDYTHGIFTSDFEQTATLTVTADGNTSSPLNGTAGEYDADGDGEITIQELADAGSAYTDGELTIQELADVGAAYTDSN